MYNKYVAFMHGKLLDRMQEASRIDGQFLWLPLERINNNKKRFRYGDISRKL